jgi:hypothetical protein
MRLAAGAKLGPYEIVAPIGAGREAFATAGLTKDFVAARNSCDYIEGI